MSQKVFFPRSFLGTNVDFADESTTNGMGLAHKSTWTVSKKLDEDVYQQDENSYLTFGPVSRSIAIFLCHNVEASDDVKIMKIMMQIPYAGTEFETVRERGKQASQSLPYFVEYEFDARKILAANGCDAAPFLRFYKRETQTENDIVPGGWIIHMLIEQAPGERLGRIDAGPRTRFWSLPASVRWEVRRAFQTAWQDCVKVGVLPQDGNLDDLWWDPTSKKVYINRFRAAIGANVNATWDDLDFALWGLIRGSFIPIERDDVTYSADKNWVM